MALHNEYIRDPQKRQNKTEVGRQGVEIRIQADRCQLLQRPQWAGDKGPKVPLVLKLNKSNNTAKAEQKWVSTSRKTFQYRLISLFECLCSCLTQKDNQWASVQIPRARPFPHIHGEAIRGCNIASRGAARLRRPKFAGHKAAKMRRSGGAQNANPRNRAIFHFSCQSGFFNTIVFP